MANINEQPDPIPNDTPAIWDLVLADMKARDEYGRKKYGTPLQAFNGRNVLRDAKEEILDLIAYLEQEEVEREWINQELMKVYVRLAESQHLQREDIVWIVDSLRCVLERNHARFVV
jgi:hypothetical protein